jgi:RNA polymerase sigma-70 factor (ECF subfamily)
MNDAAVAVGRIFERLLVVRCQTGEAAALAELIARYGPRLRFYLRKMTADSVADDLLQDVWIDVFAKIARLNDPDAFAGWVYRIARDRAYRELRRRRIATVAVDERVIDSAGSTVDDEPRWSAEDVEQLRAALDELPIAQREVLLLQFVEQMTYEQIAAVVGCPVGTVRSRIHHAKGALRAALEHKLVGKDERT